MLLQIKKNAVFGLVAPSGPINPNALEAGIRLWEGMGFRLRYSSDILDRHRYFAGEDETRARLLHEALCDEKIDALLFARGGSGAVRTLRILEGMDSSRWRFKPIFGFSDSTTLLNFFAQRLGWVSYHSPSLSTLPTYSLKEQEIWRNRVVSGMENGFALAEKTENSLQMIFPGEATGILAGGNLSTLVSLIGTPWQINLEEKILFLEDVNEIPYRLDRLLCQLRFSGLLQKVKGVILGKFTFGGQPISEPELKDMVHDHFGELGIPVMANFPAGHVPVNRILPVGARIQIHDGASPNVILAGN